MGEIPKKMIRSDHIGSGRKLFQQNKKMLMATSDGYCAICGKPLDFNEKWPSPLSVTADHIIPLIKGGDNTIDNLALVHWCCNRAKSDKVFGETGKADKKTPAPITNRNLPQTYDWINYKPKKS